MDPASAALGRACQLSPPFIVRGVRFLQSYRGAAARVKKADLAQRLSLSERQVQRYIVELEQAGLVQRIERTASHRGKISNEYDLSGLVKKLAELEPEFRQVADAARAARAAVAKKGLRHRGKKPDEAAEAGI